ncbi:MAG: recombinase family protein [Lachnospiraceae bacterium]|nr:recombinase family protein [Lachnospiraceae bacterium]
MDNIKKIYHAAAYERLSKEDGDIATSGKTESNSISNQRSLIENFISENDDIVLTREYVDDGYSGANFDRPHFQMMLEDIKKGVIDCVIVKDLSRFGREYIDSGMYIERLFPALGVRFIAINDHVDTINDRQDDIILPFKNLMNDAYCRDISIKIRSHLAVKRKNGEYVGAFVAYGYLKSEDDPHKIVPDPYASEIVKDIFRMKLQGMSTNTIADNLNLQGVLCPMEYKHSIGIRVTDNLKTHEKAQWSPVSVRRILENEIYTGVLIQGRRSSPNNKIKKLILKPESDWVRIEDNHEAIIDRKNYELVQKLLGMDSRTSPNESEVYPLSGIVVCADCGCPMIKKNVPAGGKVYSYYVCSRHDSKKDCSPHRISKDKLEADVLALLRVHIENVMNLKEVLDYVDTIPFQQIEIRNLEKRKDELIERIAKVKSLRDHLYEDMRAGLLPKEDYMEMYEGYTDNRKKAEEALAVIENEMSAATSQGSDKFRWLEYFSEHKNIEKLTRLVAVELIEQVRVVDKKHIDVVFTFNDCYQSLIRHLRMMGYEVDMADGKISIEKMEVC